MTRTIVPVAVVAAALATLPAAAEARSGWKLPAVVGTGGGVQNTSTAKRCGKKKFGTYRFTNRTSTGAVRYSVEISRDGALNKPRRIRFSGRLDPALRSQTRTLLRTARYRYKDGKVQSVMPDGSIQAQRPFNPARTRRC